MSNISEIIARHLLSQTTADEERELEAWRMADAENEAVYQRLSDTAFLEGEWRRRKAVNWQRAARQMQERVGRKRQWPVARIAAGIALLAIGGAIAIYMLDNASPAPEPQLAAQAKPSLEAGATKAVLTLADGKQVKLDKPATASQIAERIVQEAGSAEVQPIGDTPSNVSLSVPRGGEFRIELEDGTEVWLNAQSQLVYPESFGDDERRVQVDGEAYFRVAKNESKPFYVETAGQVVRVVGTEFNVHSYTEDKTVQTTLVSGQVAMQRQGDTSREMILTPGHQAVFDKAGGEIKVKSVDTEVVTSWKDGMFVFEDMTLADIMLTLSRWYDFDYEFKDHKAAGTVFMGRIPRYSDFADVMEIIELSGGLRLKLEGRYLIIEST